MAPSPWLWAARQLACVDEWLVYVARLAATVVRGRCTPIGFQTLNRKSGVNHYGVERLTIFSPCCIPPMPAPRVLGAAAATSGQFGSVGQGLFHI